MKVLGYVRVSTNKQEVGPEVQIKQLQDEAERQGWELEIRREDAASAGSLEGRPVLAQALEDLREHRADALAVSKLDRLSRSAYDFAGLLREAEREGWNLVCLDISVDTTTVMGRAMAQMFAVFAEMERARLIERTTEGMAYIKATTGKHMGRPYQVTPAAVARAKELRASGLTIQAVADALNAEGVPTPKNARWWPSSVKRVLKVKEEHLCHT